jgi:proteasome lid subunit RPN8/RPN11
MSGQAVDVRQIDTGGLPEKRFPGGRGLRLFMDRAAHETAWRQALESVAQARTAGRSPLEVGGVLLGNVCRDGEGPFLEILAAIPAEHTRNQGTQMTFTPDSWAQVNRVRDEKYSDLKMVGWYHTHPNFGIFLSEMDQAIHRRGFSQPWSTAFVIDPVREKEGFFVWIDGEPRPAAEYWVGTERRDSSWIGTTAVTEAETARRSPSAVVSRKAFAVATAINLLAVVVLTAYFYLADARRSELERFVEAALKAQKADLQASVAAIEGVRREMENSRAEARSKDAELERTVRRLRAGVARAERAIAALQESGGAAAANPPVEVKKK